MVLIPPPLDSLQVCSGLSDEDPRQKSATDDPRQTIRDRRNNPRREFVTGIRDQTGLALWENEIAGHRSRLSRATRLPEEVTENPTLQAIVRGAG
jgi:hypothetical protein